MYGFDSRLPKPAGSATWVSEMIPERCSRMCPDITPTDDQWAARCSSTDMSRMLLFGMNELVALGGVGGGSGGGLTNAELRAAPVPVSGTVAVSNFPAGFLAAQSGSWTVGVTGTVAVTGTFFQDTQPVSVASLPLPTNAATDRSTAAEPFSARLSDGAAFYNAPTAAQLPSALVSGRLDVNAGGWLGSTAPTVGQKTMANAIPVVICSDQSTINVAAAAASALFKGRSCTFRTPGRAGTTGQKILSIHNATGSAA